MLYELIAVVRTGNPNYVKDAARSTSQLLLQRKSTIRNLTNWGIFDLPSPTTKYQTKHHRGHYFIMQFDSSVTTQNEVRRQLGLNPHLIRYSIVKLGDKLGSAKGRKGGMENITGQVDWTARRDEMMGIGDGLGWEGMGLGAGR